MKRYAIGLVFLALFAGGLGVGYMVTRDQPERVVAEALRQLREADSFFGAATIATTAPSTLVAGDPSTTVMVPVVLAGGIQAGLVEGDGVRGSAALTIINAADITGSQDIKLDVQAANDGRTYVRLGNVPKEASALAGEIADQWFQIDTRAFGSLLVGETEGPTTPPEEGAGSWERLMAIVTDGDLFLPPEPLGSQLLGEVPTWQYLLPIRQPKLLELIVEAKSMARGSRLTAAEQSAIDAAILKRDLRLKIWVDKRTKRLVQADLTVWKLGMNADETRQLGILVTFRGYDQPFDVPPPEEALPLGEILKKMRELRSAGPDAGQPAP